MVHNIIENKIMIDIKINKDNFLNMLLSVNSFILIKLLLYVNKSI